MRKRKMLYYLYGNLLILGAVFLIILLQSASVSSLIILASVLPAGTLGHIFLLREKIKFEMHILMFFIIAALCTAVPHLSDFSLLGSRLKNASVEDAYAHRWANYISFSEIQSLPQFQTEAYSYYAGRKKSDSYSYKIFLIPLVDKEWKEGNPIKVWAASSESDRKADFLDRLQKNRIALKTLLHQNHYSEIKKETEETGKKHSLNVDPSPLILSIPEKPDEILFSQLLNVLAALGAASLLWITGAAFVLFRKEEV
ncbi:MAG TPA: hypothetical protein PL048_04010 [Leptospiraceae bacterium]|nr:hypothetical protein [Leptospiraceae bacterium]HNF12755.1 hypothetical protein [Leptospiraceae bacterium]